MAIKHLWLDFSDTIARTNKEALANIAHNSYAAIVGKPVGPELAAEYQALLAQHKSNAAVFAALGQPASFLADQAANYSPADLYTLTEDDVPAVIKQLTELVPVSIFSNNRLDTILPALGLEPSWFVHILGPDQVHKPKPALDGFYKMVELSGAPAGEVLYVGDDVAKDVLPAKQVGLRAGLLWANAPEADYCFANFGEILQLIKMNV